MTVIMQLLGPLGNMKIRQIRKTVWFWGILLGLHKYPDLLNYSIAWVFILSSLNLSWYDMINSYCLIYFILISKIIRSF